MATTETTKRTPDHEIEQALTAMSAAVPILRSFAVLSEAAERMGPLFGHAKELEGRVAAAQAAGAALTSEAAAERRRLETEHNNDVARRSVEVGNLDREIAGRKAALAEVEQTIEARKKTLAGLDEQLHVLRTKLA